MINARQWLEMFLINAVVFISIIRFVLQIRDFHFGNSIFKRIVIVLHFFLRLTTLNTTDQHDQWEDPCMTLILFVY